MWFLIKGAFWFSMVLVVLSYFSGQPATEEASSGPRLEVGDAIAAATDAYAYLSEICSQKPDVCVKGAETFAALGHRAREGAFVAYQFLDKQFADGAEPAAALADAKGDLEQDVIVTGTVGAAVPTPRPKPAS